MWTHSIISLSNSGVWLTPTVHMRIKVLMVEIRRRGKKADARGESELERDLTYVPPKIEGNTQPQTRVCSVQYATLSAECSGRLRKFASHVAICKMNPLANL